MSTLTRKLCTRCDTWKLRREFYPNKTTRDGLSPCCRDCDNARSRKATPTRLNRQRARNRAVADLIARHRDEFNIMLAVRLAEAREEARLLALTPAARTHYSTEPVRLRPGARRDGQDTSDRIDVARCPHCVGYHDRGHVCSACGAKPTNECDTPSSTVDSTAC